AGIRPAEIVVTTGGTGSSDVDFLHGALNAMGATFLFDGIAVRPGGPTLLARLADGRLVLGLPGNPLAAMMGVIGLLGPLITVSGGGAAGPLQAVVLTGGVDGRQGVTTLVPFVLENGRAVGTPWSGSAMMRGLAAADGVAICPPAGVGDGETVQYLRLPWTSTR
ncbi:MAG: molybdopterin molybdenumtransferase MoeA, partial [Glaciihabitans sp.]|nr:molybdopterin molybdenumtransferase MoeA [Glaciihabitans sp.]